MSRIAAIDTGATPFFDHADPEWQPAQQRPHRLTLDESTRRPG
jgi:hypothetical protein